MLSLRLGKRPGTSIFRRLIPIVLVLGVVVVADASGSLRPLDALLGDVRMAAVPRPPSNTITLVDIDAKSLAAIGRWPWPRSVHAKLIDGLSEAGASEIAVDIDFSAASTEDEDATLEASLVRVGGGVILPAFKQRESGLVGGSIQGTQPLARFADHSWSANVNIRPDADGIVRRVQFGDTIGDRFVPSLAAVLGGGVGSSDQEFLVDFSIDAGAIDRISAIDLLERVVQRERIAGRKVIIGSEAVELGDTFRVPVYGFVSGSMVQALAAETLVQDRYLIRSGFGLTLIGLLVAALTFAFVRGRLPWTRLLMLLGVAGIVIEGAAILTQWLTPLSIRTAPWLIALGTFGVLVVAREIDFRRILLIISRTQSHNTQTMLDRVVDDNFAGILVVDEFGCVRVANQAAEVILGQSIFAGRKASVFLPPAMASAAAQAITNNRIDRSPAPVMGKLELRDDLGGRKFVEYIVTPSYLTGGLSVEGSDIEGENIACLTFSDVTERHLASERVERLARFDTLTALANRNEFMGSLGVALATNDAVAVLCIDLDRFQNVNDALGHNVGDHLLVAVAERLQAIVPPADLVARFGGDDYGVIMVGRNALTRARDYADALLARVAEPFSLGAHRVIAGVSIGMAHGGRMDALELLRRADTALHRAKRDGGNRWMGFVAGMLAGLEARQDLELALWGAFERGEFEVFYQPQVDLSTGTIVGVEALLRWYRPGVGYIPPSEFVAVAETIGLIRPLGEWVLRTACADAATWPEAIRLAVNVSSLQFTRGDLVATVDAALAASRLPAGRLELEITESLLMTENTSATAQIQALSAAGVRFALDDFGTGYSSLGYIARFPINKIKLDRSFISGIPYDDRAVAVVRAVGLLANDIGVQLNAEGIETAEQFEFLWRLGFNEGQGHLFAKAMPSELLAQMLFEMGKPEARTMMIPGWHHPPDRGPSSIARTMPSVAPLAQPLAPIAQAKRPRARSSAPQRNTSVLR